MNHLLLLLSFDITRLFILHRHVNHVGRSLSISRLFHRQGFRYLIHHPHNPVMLVFLLRRQLTNLINPF